MDRDKAEALAARITADMGGAFALALAYVGDRLGIFAAMRGTPPLTSEELAARTGLHERYLREWLRAMVAAEYLDYNRASSKFVMTEEQAAVLADADDPLCAGGAFQFTAPTVAQATRMLGVFAKGGGIPYAEMAPDIPEAIERFLRPGYVHSLAREWLGAVAGLGEKLERGARALDVGCGRGQSTVAMAVAYPRSRFVGVDCHGPSLEAARSLAIGRGARNVEWRLAPADQLRERGAFDLACAFECIHDMANPRGAMRAIREALAPDGVLVWREPRAQADPLLNRNPIGKLLACVSPLHCLTVSLAQGGEGLGATLGAAGARALAVEAGFTRFEELPLDDPFAFMFAVWL